MYTDNEARHIVEVLDRKRKQLDDEIAKFKAEKEMEFQAFEKNFRDMLARSARKADDDTGISDDGKHEMGAHIPSRNRLEGPASMQHYSPRYKINRENNRPSELSRSFQEASLSAFNAARRNGAASDYESGGRDKNGQYHVMAHSHGKGQADVVPHRPLASRSPKSDSYVSPRRSYLEAQAVNTQGLSHTHHHPENRSLTRDRDLEVPGLFVPNYLPLLSKDHSTESTISEIDHPKPLPKTESDSGPLPSSNKPNRQTTDHVQKLTTKPPRLSLPTNTTLSPPATTSQRLSSSNPTRTSSPIPTNLPSSLRSPTGKKVRSPKRVLFQIDDVVFTPSSTPPHKMPSSSTVYVMPSPKETVSSTDQNSAADDHSPKPGDADSWKGDTEMNQPSVGEEGKAFNEGHHGTGLSATRDTSNSAAAATEPTMPTDNEPDDLFLFDEEIVHRADVSSSPSYHRLSHHQPLSSSSSSISHLTFPTDL